MHKAFEYFEDFLKVAARLIILQIKQTITEKMRLLTGRYLINKDNQACSFSMIKDNNFNNYNTNY